MSAPKSWASSFCRLMKSHDPFDFSVKPQVIGLPLKSGGEAPMLGPPTARTSRLPTGTVRP